MGTSDGTSADPYPVSCAFCGIAAAYPLVEHASTCEAAGASSTADEVERLKSYVPVSVDADKVSPGCHLVLNAPNVMSFLDIMPMTQGHLLVTSRSHHVKIEDLPAEEARDLGFWLPILAKAVMRTIDCTDYNLVQNNGPRAAQVVPHVHVHIIPRPESVPQIQHRSWTMFGRGAREDLDDDEAAALSAEIRRQTRLEIERRFGQGSKL